MMKVAICFMIYVTTYSKSLTTGLSIDNPLQNDSDDSSNSYIQFENSKEYGDNALLKKFERFLEKPTKEWRTPLKLSSHPSSCERLTYCERETRPTDGTFHRLPIYPWWYYSCEGTKVICKPCPTTGNLDQPTLFFSERCQQCISEYKDEKIRCPTQSQNSRPDENASWLYWMKSKFRT